MSERRFPVAPLAVAEVERPTVIWKSETAEETFPSMWQKRKAPSMFTLSCSLSMVSPSSSRLPAATYSPGDSTAPSLARQT